MDPGTGAVSIYHPLIINQDNAVTGVDFITPVTPTLPADAVVGLWFGSNGLSVTLAGDNTTRVNGYGRPILGNSIFGKFAYCNAVAFFEAVLLAEFKGCLLFRLSRQSKMVLVLRGGNYAL